MSVTRNKISVLRGFTLLELMIALVVVGILGAIALPAYTGYVQRGKIAEATGQLSTLRVQMEQFYQDNRNYGAGSACGVAMLNTPSFNLTCAQGASATWQSFVLTATGTSAGGMVGYNFTINESGAQITTAFPNATVPASCWLKRATEVC